MNDKNWFVILVESIKAIHQNWWPTNSWWTVSQDIILSSISQKCPEVWCDERNQEVGYRSGKWKNINFLI